MIAIIDYGMGNLASVRNAFTKLGYPCITSSDPEQILKAQKVVLPGVGAFADAMKNIRSLGLEDAIKETITNQIPLLGICLGLQLFFSESSENGCHKGLDIISGKVEKLPPSRKVPHMGWNSINNLNPQSKLFTGIKRGAYFYFVHSYYVIPSDEDVIATTTEYGMDFVCAIEKDNIFATQFHPEKSGQIGLQILNNFGEM